MPEIASLLDSMAEQTRRHFEQRGIEQPIVVGIHSGGVWIAEALRQRMGYTRPMGKLDISFYRDDFSRIGMHPQVRPSELPRNWTTNTSCWSMTCFSPDAPSARH